MYWYELIHRPASPDTVAKGYEAIDSEHVNRNGFIFGKVAYANKLTESERRSFDLEPEHLPEMVEISMVNQSFLNDNHIKITVHVLDYLIEKGEIAGATLNNWQYIHVEELRELATSRKEELKQIYKELKKVYQNS